jgi:hypothetical protein
MIPALECGPAVPRQLRLFQSRIASILSVVLHLCSVLLTAAFNFIHPQFLVCVRRGLTNRDDFQECSICVSRGIAVFLFLFYIALIALSE